VHRVHEGIHVYDRDGLDSALADEYLRPFVEASAALTSYDVSSITKTDYKLGLRVSQPLFFRSASAGAQVAQIGVQRADLTRLLVERTVDADAAAAVVAVTRTQERLTLALEEVRLARAMVDAERRRFIAGESTLLNLNLRERFLAEALLRQVSAQGDLARARISLLWATGTI
jgi:outer membrane protein TolC